MSYIKPILLLFLIVSITNVSAQKYFVVGDDTTFCNELKHISQSNGYLKILEYTTTEGKKVALKGRKNVPDVTTFFSNDTYIDKVPLKANKPNSYIRYNERLVNGKLKVYLSKPYKKFTASGSYYAGSYRFFLKMPDGVYLKIDSKGNMKKLIKPFLLDCSSFKDNYKGDFSTSEKAFMEMIELYNSLCN